MTNGHETTNGHATNGGSTLVKTRAGREIPHGASQVGVFDLVPKLGYREYWYPVIHDNLVKRKPIGMKMLGEDLVLFRDENNEVKALSDFCPHRGARLSGGIRRTPGGGPDTGKLNNEFNGYVTCPYHGYTFNGEGVCVAALTDGPNSGLVGKLRAPAYPTKTHRGVVWVWMGETEPVPLEEDMPPGLLDPNFTGRRYLRVRDWEANWTEPVLQGIDFHEFYLHRWAIFWRIFHKNLGFFRPKPVYQGNVRVADERENAASFRIGAVTYGQAYYPGVDAKWPVKAWWRKLGAPSRKTSSINRATPPTDQAYGAPAVTSTNGNSTNGANGTNGNGASTDVLPANKKLAAGLVLFGKAVQLPSIIYFHRGGPGDVVQMRWGVPITEETVRMWTFNVAPKPKTPFGSFWQALWYYAWRLPSGPVMTNEKEDLAVFKKTRLNLEGPQKLGPLDTGVIYFRRHLAKRARDYQRLGWARGVRREAPVEKVTAKETVSNS